MPAGLEIYDENNKLVLGLTGRTCRQLGMLANVGGSAGANGVVTSDGFATGTPFAIVVPIGTGDIPAIPDVTFTGTTMRWRYRTEGNQFPPGTSFLMCNILYGVY